MELKPGSRWKSAVCDTEVVVVRAAQGGIALECGGHPMIPHAEARPEGLTVDPAYAGGAQPGKRFADDVSGLEVLCTKGGKGSLSIDGREIGGIASECGRAANSAAGSLRITQRTRNADHDSPVGTESLHGLESDGGVASGDEKPLA